MKKFNQKIRNLFIMFIIAIVFIIYPSNIYAEGADTLLSKKLNITLHLTAHDNLSGVSKVIISNYSDFRGAEWEDYCEEKKVTLDNKADKKTIYIKYMDNAGNVSEVSSKVIPERFFEETIFINKDDLYTNKDKIILKINTTEDAKEFSLSNDKKNWNPWELFKNEIEYDVNGDEGKKEIYIQFKNKEGKVIKKLVPGILVYDKTSPVIENIQLSLDKITNKVKVSADIHDNSSGVYCKKWASGKADLDYFKNHGTDLNENNIVVNKNGDYTLYAEDIAGNASIKGFTVNIITNTTEENEKDKVSEDVDNKNIGDNVENDDKKNDAVSEEKEGTTPENSEPKVEENQIDSNNSISNKTNKNNINNKKKVYTKGIKYLWLWWLLALIIIYIVWKKYKKHKANKKEGTKK